MVKTCGQISGGHIMWFDLVSGAAGDEAVALGREGSRGDVLDGHRSAQGGVDYRAIERLDHLQRLWGRSNSGQRVV